MAVQAPTTPRSEKHTENALAKWLAAGITVATALLVAVGVSGEALSRLIRIHPTQLVVGAALLLLASVLGAVALAGVLPDVLSGIGLCAFVTGLMVLVYFHADANSRQERPTVSVGLETADNRLRANVSVQASNLKPDQYVFLLIQGQNGDKQLRGNRAGFDPANATPVPPGHLAKQRLYKGRLGPSPSGGVDSDVIIELSTGVYDEVVVQAEILTNGESSVIEERTLETQKDPVTGRVLAFPCTSATGNLGCGTVLVPLPEAAN